MYKLIVKPVFDTIVAFLAIIISMPVWLPITLLLFIINYGKPFFIQKRPGYHEKIFEVIKFKTMNDQVNADGNLLPDDQRLTMIGKLIRKTSIDEIPQLLNVFKGDMSFIGPRPLLVEYLPLYNEEQRKRHKVKPGITGWAQVNGRNAISWSEKFEYDVWYVEHQSFWLDVKILFLTVLKVFKAEGINGEGVATMKKFTGNL